MKTSSIPVKIVLAKVGLDGHDRGVKVVARALRDAGMEVVYTGIFQTPASIVRTVLQEDAQVLGLSSLSGAHMEYAEELVRLLSESGLGNVLFVVGGTVPTEDAGRLRLAGVAEVFGPGSSTHDIVAFIRSRTGRTASTPIAAGGGYPLEGVSEHDGSA